MGIIVDKNADKKIFFALDKMNMPFCKSFDMPMLYKPVNTHPDMQIHFVDGKTAVAAPASFEYYRSCLPKYIELLKGSADPGGTYPGDCAYNVVRMGKNIIGNLKYTDPVILNFYELRGYNFINVKQGYTKCSLCIVDENSAITEDEGLYKTLNSAKIDVLKIERGGVRLDGFDYGFIGGASGLISENKLAFFGDISKHSDYESIKKFIKTKKVDIIQLSSTNLADYGSIIKY